MRVAKPSVRRVFVRETVEIPVDTAANVAVRLPYTNMHAPNADWLTESREVRPGLLAARTLLSGDDKHAAIRFINLSGVSQTVRQGLSLGVAAPCCADHTEVRPLTTPPMADHPAAGESSYNDCATGRDQATARPASDTPPRADSGVFTITASDAVDLNDDDCTHVQPVIDRLPDSLTADQRQQAIELIKRNADVFSRHEFDVGCTTVLTACINTTHDRPIAEPLR